MEKNRLREIALEKRKSLNPEIRKESNLMIQKHAYEKIRDKSLVGIYVSKPEEVCTHDLIEWCFNAQIRVAVPKVNGKRIDFIEIQSLTDLKKGSFN